MDVLVSKNKSYNNYKYMFTNILIYLILQFPISSLLKVYIGPLNVILTALCFILFFTYYIQFGCTIKEFFFINYIILTIFQNIVKWGFNYWEKNMLFYFPFLILFFLFFTRNIHKIFCFMKNHRMYVDGILLIWNLIVGVSLFIPSCYVYEGETKGFVSFAGTTFLLCAISVYIFVLLTYQYYIYRKKIYMFALIIPSLCILLGTARTYLVVLMCAWLIFIYINMRDQKYFLPVMILVIILFIIIVILSPIKNKFIDAFVRTQNLGIDPLEAFTSGRSVFWNYDLKNIFKNNLFNIIFGNGVNYLFNLNKARFGNPLWAHNDFIQVLSDYGLFGIGIYLYIFYYPMKTLFYNLNISKIIKAILVLMWSFNAFFNMFYTYFCVALSFPFYLMIIRYDAESRIIVNQSKKNN